MDMRGDVATQLVKSILGLIALDRSDTMLNGNWSPRRDKALIDLWRIRDKGKEE